MIIELNKAIDWGYKKKIEVNTIKDLCKIMDENKSGLVIKFNGFEADTKNGIRVIIYDDYIE